MQEGGDWNHEDIGRTSSGEAEYDNGDKKYPLGWNGSVWPAGLLGGSSNPYKYLGDA